MDAQRRSKSDSNVAAAVTYRRAFELLDALEHVESFATVLNEPFVALDRFGRILRMAPAVAKILGYPPERLVGRRLNHRIRREDRGAFVNALGGLREVNLSISVRTKSGSYESVRVSLLSSARIDGYGTVVLLSLVREPTA